MITFTIQIPDKNRDLFERLAEKLNGKIINAIEDGTQPNSVTQKAITDARSGKTQKIKEVDSFFKSI